VTATLVAGGDVEAPGVAATVGSAGFTSGLATYVSDFQPVQFVVELVLIFETPDRLAHSAGFVLCSNKTRTISRMTIKSGPASS
jgi:hypothetical protein